jgi:hypothetical protein
MNKNYNSINAVHKGGISLQNIAFKNVLNFTFLDGGREEKRFDVNCSKHSPKFRDVNFTQ